MKGSPKSEIGCAAIQSNQSLPLHLSRPCKEENLILSYFPCHQLRETFFPVSHVINSGKPSGDRVSFRSPSPSPNTFRSVGKTTHRRRNFPANFSGDVFFRHRPYQKERLEEIYNFCEGTGTKISSTRRPRVFFRPATASHALAREGA